MARIRFTLSGYNFATDRVVRDRCAPELALHLVADAYVLRPSDNAKSSSLGNLRGVDGPRRSGGTRRR